MTSNVKTIVGSDKFVVTRNNKTNVTMIENRVKRTIFPIDDKEWTDFVQNVVTANRHVLREIEKG